MNNSKEFQINKFLSLKLEKGKTNIYVNGNLFRQCTLLILNIPIDEVGYFDEVKSIDDAAEKLGWSEDKQEKSVRNNGYFLSPEEEFLGHCSNLQVWYEYKYDTRLLHHSLSFWLLRELSDYDPVAKSVFKEELAKRYGSGCESVLNFLDEEFDISAYLNHEEILHAELIPEEAEILLDIETMIGDNYHFISGWRIESPRDFVIKNRHVIRICMNDCLNDTNSDKFSKMLDKLSNLKYLECLLVNRNELENLPDSIANFENLIYLDLSRNALTHIPPILKIIKSLQFVDLSKNKIFNDNIIYKNTFIQLRYRKLSPFSKLTIEQMYKILEKIKKCNLFYLTLLVINFQIPPEDIFQKLLQYHKMIKGKKGVNLVYVNNIISLT